MSERARVCARGSSRVWPGLSPDASPSLAWRSIDLYGNTACSHSRSNALSYSVISAQLWDARCVLSFDCVCVCVCVIGVTEWGLQYAAQRLGSARLRGWHVCVVQIQRVGVWTHICLLMILLINLVNSQLPCRHTHTHTHTRTHTHDQTHTAPACPDRIRGVRYSDQKPHPTSSYQHHPSFCLPPALPLALLFLPREMSQSCPFPSSLPSSPSSPPPFPLPSCLPHFLSYPIHLSLSLAASPRSLSLSLSTASLSILSSPRCSAEVATLFCSRARH